MSIRLALLIMLLYHYSSFEKCILLVLVICAVYGFNQGWFALRGGPEVYPPHAPEPPPEENNLEETDEGTQNGQENLAEVEEEPTAWEVFWSTCYIFITSFFASMIPERAPPGH